MAEPLSELHIVLEERTAEALKHKAFSNRGTLAAFQLPSVAKSLTEAIIRGQSGGQAAEFGVSLGQEGLSIISALEAQHAALNVVVAIALEAERVAAQQQVLGFYSQFINGLCGAEQREAEQRRAQIEQAFVGMVEAQHEAQHRLQLAIRELSTPIMPVAEGILVLPLVGSVDNRRASEVNEQLLEGIAKHQAELVIIDITGVPTLDTTSANVLLQTARAARLLGSQVILCGIGPEIAQTIIRLGVELSGITTLANMQTSLAYALGKLGLGIKPL